MGTPWFTGSGGRSRRAAGVVTALLLGAYGLVGCADATGPVPSSSPSGPAPRALVPPATPVDLPANRSVGPAALIYLIDRVAYLVTIDGGQYRLPGDGPRGTVFSLSPNGRWLLRNDQLRDLTGNGVRQLGIGGSFMVQAWSPNGQWLLVNGPTGPLLVPTTTDDRAVPVHTPGLAVLDDGGILVAERGEGVDVGDPKRATLRVLDPATGALRREITIDTNGSSADVPIEGRFGVPQLVAGPRETLMIGGTAGDGGALAVIASARDGRVFGAVRPPTGPDPRSWHLLGFLDREVLIRGTGTVPSGVRDDTPAEIVATTPGGSFRRLYQLPAVAQVISPGAAGLLPGVERPSSPADGGTTGPTAVPTPTT